jgi:hypothetical protein
VRFNEGVKKRTVVTTQGNLKRSTQWAGLRTGDSVVVNSEKELRMTWVFVAHVTNIVSNEEWVEVRGGRSGEMKSRSFRCDLIYPASAKRGPRVVGLSLAAAPQLGLG